MKRLILALLCLSPGLALTQTPPPTPATVADVLAGTATYKFISPAAAAGAGLSSPTNGVTANTVTNIVNGLAPGLSVSNAVFATNVTGSLFAKVRYVSSTGNNTTALAGNPLYAYASISNATAASSYGDLVYVLPGNYTGQVNMVEGVKLYYEAGATHYTPSGQYNFVVGSVTNVQVWGLGSFPGSGGSGGSDGRTMFNVSNVLTDIYFDCYRIGGVNGSTADDLLTLGSYKSLHFKSKIGGLLSWGSYNTNSSALLEWRDGDFEGYYQHLDVKGTNRWYNAAIDFTAMDENNFGFLEMYGGQYFDNASPQSLTGGNITMFGPRVSTTSLYSSFLYAPTYGNYPTATNVHGFWLDVNDDKLVMQNKAMVQNQGGAAELELSSRSGNATEKTNRFRFDGTNNILYVFAPSGAAPSVVANLNGATNLPPITGIAGWPANSSGYLNNNGSGTLSWGTPSGTLPADTGVASLLTNSTGGTKGWFPIASLPAGSGGGFYVTNSAVPSLWTNLFGGKWDNSGSSPIFSVGLNTYLIGGDGQVSRIGGGLELDAGSGGFFVGDVGGATAAGDFNLNNGTVNSLNVAGTGAGLVTVKDSGGANKITLSGTAGVAGFAGDIYLTNRAASKILRTDANKGTAEVTVGTGLSFDGTTLSASGGSGWIRQSYSAILYVVDESSIGATTIYYPLLSGNIPSATFYGSSLSGARFPGPTGGYISNLFAHQYSYQFPATTNLVITLCTNVYSADPVASALAVTVDNSNQNATDTTHSAILPSSRPSNLYLKVQTSATVPSFSVKLNWEWWSQTQ